jgi:mRNA-degrading endonuclease RelE of RelBE toxin-antitoxin system
MHWTVRASNDAQKALARADGKDRRLLTTALKQLETDPLGGNLKRLTNERATFRHRVGDWRIFFDLYPESFTVHVVAIERRTTTTYRKR